MYGLTIAVTSVFIAIALSQISGLLTITFLIVAMLVVPAAIIHRREVAAGIECGPESEGAHWGLLRLAGSMTVDLTGITLGTLLLILGILAVYLLGGSHLHV